MRVLEKMREREVSGSKEGSAARKIVDPIFFNWQARPSLTRQTRGVQIPCLWLSSQDSMST